MELKYTMATVFLFFLLLDLPHFSSGYRDKLKGEAHEGSSMEEVYEIDYRGPETHPVMPLPSGGKPRFRPQHPNSRPLGQSKAPKVNKLRG